MGSNWLNYFFKLPRTRKRALQLITDSCLIAGSFLLAMALRLDHGRFIRDVSVWYALLALIPFTLVIFVRLGFYRAVIRYISGKAFRVIMIGVGLSAAFLLVFSQSFDLFVPRSVPFIYGLLALFSIGGVRFALRFLFFESQNKGKKRVLIYGAGLAGRQLVVSLSHETDYSVVAFVDDARELQKQQIQGVKVYPSDQIEILIQDFGIEMILLAMPSVPRSVRQDILRRLEPLPVHVRTVPGLSEMVSGKAKVGEIREVALEDLLGRDPVPPQKELMEANVKGRVVLVSGSGGSIGSELCRQIVRQRPAKLVLLEISEYNLYRCEQDLIGIMESEGLNVKVTPLLGSVRDAKRVRAAMTRFGVQTVFHAAAYKHVPMVEQNIAEGIRNNVFGTLTLAQESVKAGVQAFILISTDKAVRPTNIMGASKRMAELICQATGDMQSATIFSMVRFGNVLGSSGSVIPLFHRQIESGGPITVTHPEITRFFMTIPEASQLVIQASAMAKGGEVFVLDMGESVKIIDLATRMAKLHGLNPKVVSAADWESENASDRPKSRESGEISIVFSGLRPGEKLYEELLIGGDPQPSAHPLIMLAREEMLDWPTLEGLLNELKLACDSYRVDQICEILVRARTGYVGNGNALVDHFGVVAGSSLSAVD